MIEIIVPKNYDIDHLFLSQFIILITLHYITFHRQIKNQKSVINVTTEFLFWGNLNCVHQSTIHQEQCKEHVENWIDNFIILLYYSEKITKILNKHFIPSNYLNNNN